MTRVAKLLCLLTLVACGNPPTSEHPDPKPLTLTFASPAARYNDTTEPPPSSSLSELVLAQVYAAANLAGRRPPVPDERLFLASAGLATVVPEEGSISTPIVEFSLQTNGVIDPSPHVLVLWGDLYAAAGGGIAESLRPKLEEIFHGSDVAFVGVGAVIRGPGGYGALVLMLLRSRVRTSPIPRGLATHGVAELEFTLQPDLSRPRVLATLPSGIVEAVEPKANGANTFSAALDCGGVTGKIQFEIESGSEDGGASLAKFPVWCGVEPARTIPITRPVNDIPADRSEAERELFRLINIERVKLGRPALIWDEALEKVAREHSEDMRRTQVVAAKTPNGLSIRQRVAARRSDLEITGSVALAYGVAEVDHGLMDLPSTRRKLISAVATNIGIGIVYGEPVGGRRELYVTEIVGTPASEPPGQ